MPFMGGEQATQIIRKFEQDNGLERLPIVALTAHAMLGDREKCLQAGMGMSALQLRIKLPADPTVRGQTTTSRNRSGSRTCWRQFRRSLPLVVQVRHYGASQRPRALANFCQ